LLLVLGLCHLTFHHVRHGDLLALVAPMAATASLGPQIADKLRAMPRSALVRGFARLAHPAAMSAVLATAVPFAAIAAATELRPIDRSGDSATPAIALAAARSLGLGGPVLNSYGFGGYLTFEHVPTFIDGRVEMYGDAFLARYLAAVGGEEKTLREVLDRYRIAWTLLQPNEDAIAVFSRLPGWQRVYADSQAVIFRRAAAGASRVSAASPAGKQTTASPATQ
jgi:hypothetical protein